MSRLRQKVLRTFEQLRAELRKDPEYVKVYNQLKPQFDSELASALQSTKSVKTYRRDLRAIVRGLWSGVLGFDQSFESFQIAINRHFTQAWYAGAAECGIKPDELTEAETNSLSEQIIEQTQYISKFLEAIEAQSKSNGGKLAPLFNRVELWVNNWDRIFELAQSMACGDSKAEWILGATEKHCASCNGFNGRVYRFSVWHTFEALPQSRRLACNGYRCDCRLRQTDKPVTRGRFPARLLQ